MLVLVVSSWSGDWEASLGFGTAILNCFDGQGIYFEVYAHFTYLKHTYAHGHIHAHKRHTYTHTHTHIDTYMPTHRHTHTHRQTDTQTDTHILSGITFNQWILLPTSIFPPLKNKYNAHTCTHAFKHCRIISLKSGYLHYHEERKNTRTHTFNILASVLLVFWVLPDFETILCSFF